MATQPTAVDEQAAADEHTAGEHTNLRISPNWPQCDPSYVLEMLHSLKPEKCNLGKGFYSTYTKVWAKLTDDRRMQTQIFFNAQTIGVQQIVCDGAKALEAARNLENSERSLNTTKDDRCR